MKQANILALALWAICAVLIIADANGIWAVVFFVTGVFVADDEDKKEEDECS